ncbi:hypothetical protein [Planktotalea sp.]
MLGASEAGQLQTIDFDLAADQFGERCKAEISPKKHLGSKLYSTMQN